MKVPLCPISRGGRVLHSFLASGETSEVQMGFLWREISGLDASLPRFGWFFEITV